MTETGRELVERIHRETLERLRVQPVVSGARPEPPQEELPEAPPGSPVAQEWELFRHEVARLLAAGDKGRFALIKAGQGITVWDTLRDAVQAGELLYGSEPCLIQQVLPYLRPRCAGLGRRCRD
jgi:hypothetical protein